MPSAVIVAIVFVFLFALYTARDLHCKLRGPFPAPTAQRLAIRFCHHNYPLSCILDSLRTITTASDNFPPLLFHTLRFSIA